MYHSDSSAAYMPLSSSLPSSPFPPSPSAYPPPSLPPIPPHASASSPTSSCTTTTDADPIYQNIEECRFLYDSPPAAEGEYRTIDKPSPTRPTLGASSSSQPMDTPPGYRRINSASKASPIFSLPPPPPLDDPEMQPSTSRGNELRGYDSLASKTTSPVSYYDDLSDYGEHHLVASPARRSDFRPQSQPPEQLRRMGSQKGAVGIVRKQRQPPEQLRRMGSQKGAGLLSPKSSSPCSAGCLCCLFLCTVLVFGLAYIVYFFFTDIESWTKQNVINKL